MRPGGDRGHHAVLSEGGAEIKALILKDLLCLRQQAKSVGLVLLVWLVLSVAMGNGMFFCALGVIYVIMLPMMTLSFDERSKWDSRALTMPVTRAQLVLSRYATALLAGLALCALGAVVIAAVDGPEQAASSLGFYLAGALMLAVAMPLMLKLGVEKARILVALCYLVPFLGLLLAEKLGVDVEEALASLSGPRPALIAAVIVLAALALSVLISLGIYRHKEF